MTSAMTDLDHAIRVICARCSDTLDPGSLALVEAALNGSGVETMSREVAERIAEVLDALDERLAATESRLDRIEEAA